MDCPKCGFVLAQTASECPRCGIIVAKFLRAHEDPPPPPDAGEGEEPPAIGAMVDEASALHEELTARAVALPGALLAAWLAVSVAPGAVRLLAMWVHETGHAVSAWLCGYAAWPGPWFTPIGTDRSIPVAALLAGLLTFGCYRAWQANRPGWVGVAAAGLIVSLCCTLGLTPAQARQFIVFGGDGGSMVLGTMLMLTIFAPKNSPLRRDHLRWGLLVIGALAFMDAYIVWSGPLDRLPFGENENGLSDPSVLTEAFGWSVAALVSRYLQVAHACLAALAVSYIVGVVRPAIDPLPQREPL